MNNCGNPIVVKPSDMANMDSLRIIYHGADKFQLVVNLQQILEKEPENEEEKEENDEKSGQE